MPRAEIGSTKHLANQMKSKGLQRLRWYCQVCERQMRDENGFKCHTSSEAHIRQMLLVGEDPKKFIEQYSQQFKRDFLTLLRSSHGEKKIDANRFYQEYIANKEHVHMTSTKWVTLGEFVKFLGREGVCRVEDGERGLMVAWIDNSPDALKRQEFIKKKERMERGDEVRERRAIEEMVERAKAQKKREEEEGPRELVREEGEKVKLEFGKKAESPKAEQGAQAGAEMKEEVTEAKKVTPPPTKVSMKMEAKPKKNVFASMGKKDKSSKGKEKSETLKRPISEAERIMKAEMDKRVRKNTEPGFAPGGIKRQRIG
ncbi:domain of Kin17 curved DNA-binding protein-domain-containing protein [Tricharina praecox]|uniref:domain of Kin17 curved DNA-binding protein-domain-containing protein n=1 Tax=Tricharina praecox TaxID=43433 RepID=UPI00221E659E|nr:domain of Kin17 curved DNA-binding protein-domain-containing protein [Tricharina praecox]KAI5850954.1 domain of Kin17 curved DNA-binding protein-domain-containing protein [Tricharina praecox]